MIRADHRAPGCLRGTWDRLVGTHPRRPARIVIADWAPVVDVDINHLDLVHLQVRRGDDGAGLADIVMPLDAARVINDALGNELNAHSPIRKARS